MFCCFLHSNRQTKFNRLSLHCVCEWTRTLAPSISLSRYRNNHFSFCWWLMVFVSLLCSVLFSFFCCGLVVRWFFPISLSLSFLAFWLWIGCVGLFFRFYSFTGVLHWHESASRISISYSFFPFSFFTTSPLSSSLVRLWFVCIS